MPSTPPRRPRPGPGRRATAGPRHGVVVPREHTIHAPGVAAYLRRHPRLAQRGGVAAVAGGIVLFLLAGVTTPLAGANTARPAPAMTPASRPPAPLDTAPDVAPARPAVANVLTKTPIHAKEKAPVGRGVISGLAGNGIPQVALNAYRVA